jgi:hypothetical protein
MILLLSIGCVEYALNHPAEVELADETWMDSGILGPIAEAPVYANTAGRLYEVVPATGETSTVGDFRDAAGKIDGFVDIAIDLDGRMFGGTFDAIYRIDPSTAEVEHICDTEVELYAMTFTSTGELIGGGPETLTIIDVDGGCGVEDLVSNPMFETSGDLVGLPDGYLYWTVLGEESDALVRLDPETGMFSPVGSLGYEQLYGLGYDQGELFGFSAQGQIVAISPDSADVSLRSTGSLAWWGATTNPVIW